MVDEADRHGMKVAAHAHGTEGIKAATRAGVASIEHGSMLDDEAIRLMKENGTYLVPTTYLSEAIDLSVLPPQLREKAEYVLPLAQKSLEKVTKERVKPFAKVKPKEKVKKAKKKKADQPAKIIKPAEEGPLKDMLGRNRRHSFNIAAVKFKGLEIIGPKYILFCFWIEKPCHITCDQKLFLFLKK